MNHKHTPITYTCTEVLNEYALPFIRLIQAITYGWFRTFANVHGMEYDNPSTIAGLRQVEYERPRTPLFVLIITPDMVIVFPTNNHHHLKPSTLSFVFVMFLALKTCGFVK